MAALNAVYTTIFQIQIFDFSFKNYQSCTGRSDPGNAKRHSYRDRMETTYQNSPDSEVAPTKEKNRILS